MNFIKRLFSNEMVECPRCLGKGHVDENDIKRLGKVLFWSVGKCAYCKGGGKVSAKLISTVSADLAYLTTDLPETESKKLFDGEPGAFHRARIHEERINELVRKIEHLYYLENLEFDQITEQLIRNSGHNVHSLTEKQEVMQYVENVIKSKHSK